MSSCVFTAEKSFSLRGSGLRDYIHVQAVLIKLACCLALQ